MIRVQQDQLAALQAQHTEAIHSDDTPPASQPSRSPHQRPATLSRHSSQAIASNSTSPTLRPTSSHHHEEFMLGGSRDESAFYQAETQMLTRENQMLKYRIRQLEQQLAEADPQARVDGGLHLDTHHLTHTPTRVSPLASPPINREENPMSLAGAVEGVEVHTHKNAGN